MSSGSDRWDKGSGWDEGSGWDKGSGWEKRWNNPGTQGSGKHAWSHGSKCHQDRTCTPMGKQTCSDSNKQDREEWREKFLRIIREKNEELKAKQARNSIHPESCSCGSG
eukprot:s483_g4.t1